VLAVPGNILSGRHRGCHGLIRDGAAVAESVEDILAELRASRFRPAVGRAPDPQPVDELLAYLQPGESYDVESLGRATGLPASRLLSRLLDLELRGSVRRADGGRFVRAGRTC
jgi:DNA processing protein